MVLKCQRDSFLKEFSATVEGCDEAEFTITEGGKELKKQGYAVQLNDTIIFPEGGGQPSDEGSIGDVRVERVERRGAQVLNYTLQPIPVGTVQPLSIDWQKRFDHMQQHSGQHLLSAILEKEHQLKTTAWWLGELESYVELDCSTLPQDLLPTVQERCNSLIREALPVSVTVCQKDDPNLDTAHTRGLPADHVGPVRIISIQGVDDNLCCGTHVSNLSQLQSIMLLGSEAGKKNKTNLRFLVGQRVLGRLQLSLERERILTRLLNNDPGRHAELVEKLQVDVKVLRKGEAALLDELCPAMVQGAGGEQPVLVHRAPPSPPALITSLARQLQALKPHPPLALLSQAERLTGGGPGSIVLLGPPKHVSALSQQICELLKGKGGGGGTRYQAKVTDMSALPQCHLLLKDYCAHNSL